MSLKKDRLGLTLFVQAMLLLLAVLSCQAGSAFDNSQLLKDAAHGDREARYTLAHLLLQGRGGVSRDLPAAVALLKQAAGDGHRDAAFDLAMLYLQGDRLAKDPGKTIYWLEKAAQMGHAAARLALAQAYRGIDPEKAAYWLHHSGAAGPAGQPETEQR